MSQIQLLLLCSGSAALPRPFVSLAAFPFAALAPPQCFGASPAALIHSLPDVPVHELTGVSVAAAVGSLESRADLMMMKVAAAVVLGLVASPIEPAPEATTMR
jgi:hypothetical protein